MEPIIPRQPAKAGNSKNGGRPPNTVLSRGFLRFIFTVALLTALGTFGLSVYFLVGFAMTDTGILTLLSSAALCFGVGAMGYLPTTIITYWTRKELRGDRSRGRYWLALLLLLPWLALSIILIFYSAMPLVYGAIALLITCVLLLWPLASIRSAGKSRTSM
ncbi:hypothetical protein [Fretibacter rubidus]|uniref:hypothetical protein n=1 Tax=Fretibacter rubidus TaxID=570162 RepID=UPI00352A9C6A